MATSFPVKQNPTIDTQPVEDAKIWQQAANCLKWDQPWQRLMTGCIEAGNVSWYEGGLLNASVNCLDRHLTHDPDKIAFIWQGDNPQEIRTYSYQALYHAVLKFSHVLKSCGLQTGDVVCIYLPMIPEAIIAMLSCARIGLIHTVVFAGFSADALATRIQDANAKLVITANESIRGGKRYPLKQQVDDAIRNLSSLHHVIVVARTENEVSFFKPRDLWWHEEMAKAAPSCEALSLSATSDFFILYTSGSTGKPKGVVHALGGYLAYVQWTFEVVFKPQPQDIFWCTADIGWITGHSYTVYGPLLSGITTLIFEGTPHYPTPARYFEIIDEHRVSIFYTSPTAIRALRQQGSEWLSSTTRSSLRLLGSVGEPINQATWQWYFDSVGLRRCPIVDTWWQTETGGILISPNWEKPLKAGSAGEPLPGIHADIMNEQGEKQSPYEPGVLVITQPWPGMLKSIHNDRDKMLATYFNAYPGCYLTGDQAYYDEDGNFWLEGRSDDVIKMSGHRLGSAELESALVSHPAVAEAAVVPVADEIKGQAIYAFVTLNHRNDASDLLKEALIQQVKLTIGPIATIAHIEWTRDLPKTRSGKIIRRILRKIASRDEKNFGDLSTLANPHVVESLIEQFKKNSQCKEVNHVNSF